MVTSLTLGGSYVLYRGGVLTLPRPGPADAGIASAEKDERTVPAMMAGSKSGILSFTTVSGPLTPEQLEPPRISVQPDLVPRKLQLALDPQAAGVVPISLVPTTPPMMGSSKFAVVDFSAPQAVASPAQQPKPAVRAPQAAAPPAVPQSTTQLVSEPPAKPSTPAAAPAPAQRLMLSGSKSGGISFATPPSITFPPQQPRRVTLGQPTSAPSAAQPPAQPQTAPAARR
ncbi:MAG TPA: hypothetical protein VGO11_05690 [Chthoniobacteraceae bacterium]|nr:hypothetical protein [Chthoniobacteraceae bacterium]